MRTVILERDFSGPEGTFGRLIEHGLHLCYTCEDPWNNNQQGMSCIPEGLYTCSPHSGPKYQNVWQVEGVPGRSAILVHQGNTIDDTQGCILVGASLGEVKGKPAVTGSRVALDKLREHLPMVFKLEVVNQFNKKE